MSKSRIIRRFIHRLALRGERLIDRLAIRGKGDPVLEAYRGYATADSLVLRGRVLTSLRRSTPVPEQSRLTNLLQMASLFLTGEVRDVPVRVVGHDVTATSNAEGYLSIEVPKGDVSPGWTDVKVEIIGVDETTVPFPVMVPDSIAQFGVISDVDDTMLETGAYSLARNLWTTFTGSTLTRRIFPDSVKLMEEFAQSGRNPVFYVSSSPWNLHHFLDTIFMRAGLVPGPMFLRDLGVSDRHLLVGSHGSHKSAAINRILDANPGLSFILMGDTGQHDAAVYADAVERHPGRIRAIILRAPGPGADKKDEAELDRARAQGVEAVTSKDFTSAEVQSLKTRLLAGSSAEL